MRLCDKSIFYGFIIKNPEPFIIQMWCDISFGGEWHSESEYCNEGQVVTLLFLIFASRGNVLYYKQDEQVWQLIKKKRGEITVDAAPGPGC